MAVWSQTTQSLIHDNQITDKYTFKFLNTYILFYYLLVINILRPNTKKKQLCSSHKRLSSLGIKPTISSQQSGSLTLEARGPSKIRIVLFSYKFISMEYILLKIQ